MLILGQSYPEKLLSISFGEISRNPIPHQIEPNHGHGPIPVQGVPRLGPTDFALWTLVLGTFGQFNDPVVVNNEIIRRLDNYDKASFGLKLTDLLQADSLILSMSF